MVEALGKIIESLVSNTFTAKMRRSRKSNSHYYIYLLKSRLIVWIAARYLRPCDRLLSPWSVILSQLKWEEVERAIVIIIFTC